jgi:RAD51-like protein 3
MCFPVCQTDISITSSLNPSYFCSGTYLLSDCLDSLAKQLLCLDAKLFSQKCGLDFTRLQTLMTNVADACLPSHCRPFCARELLQYGQPKRTTESAGVGEISRDIATLHVLSSGCSNIDELLDRGLWCGEVTEIVGEASTGKTQICMTAAADALASTAATVAYIDSGSSIDMLRMHSILSKRCSNAECVEEAFDKRMRIFTCPQVHALLDVIDVIVQSLQTYRFKTVVPDEDTGKAAFYRNLKLVVVDSLSAILSPVLGISSVRVPLGHVLMAHVAKGLHYLAAEYNVAVLVTNHMVSDHDADMGGRHPRLHSLKPALGPSWAHVPSRQIALLFFYEKIEIPEDEEASPTQTLPTQLMSAAQIVRRKRLLQRRAVLLKSSMLPSGIEIPFEIFDHGVSNA